MNATEFKNSVLNGLNGLVDEWFDSTSIEDTLFNGICRTVINANKNKYDNIISMFSDENGDVMIDDLIENIVNRLPEKIEIDLKQYINLPFVPNKILLLTRQDIIKIIKGI